MSQENKYRLYTAEDIISYLEGKMSPVEMRQIEMAALDDAFLQDAMDGYRLELEKGNKTPLMSSLEKVQAQQRVSRQKPASVIPFFRAGIFKWAVAAVLLVGTGFLWFNLNRTHPENAPADNSIVLQNSEQMDSTSLSDVAIATVPGAPEAEQNSPSASARPIENNKLKNSPILAAQSKQETNGADIKNAIDRRGVLVTPPIASADKLQKLNNTETKTESFYLKDAASSSVASASSIQTEPAGARNSLRPKTQQNNALEKATASSRHYLAGKTFDKEKFPLDNVVIAVKGDTIKTISDEMGRFSLLLPDTSATLVASGIGVKTKEYHVNTNRGKVELELARAESSLSEVVVSGYSTKRKWSSEIALDLDTSEAAPAGGWQNFERYVLENRRIKPGKNKIAVVLSIEIEENGKVGAMEIIESAGNALDKEAIRLLKNGPIWINKTKEKVAFAKVTIVL